MSSTGETIVVPTTQSCASGRADLLVCCERVLGGLAQRRVLATNRESFARSESS